ncbi:hypothetical protein ACTHAM_002416 [Cellulomonas soli]|uniref:hypothetical protein n=1 Tax=Cellulomonas soli TaxID=931535 RepID=UPI003F825EE8
MPVSMLTATAYVAGESVPCGSTRVVLDEGWAPHVAAQLTIPYTPERAAALDPRTGARVLVEVSRRWHGGLTLGDLSEAWEGMTLADLSAEWVSYTLADLTVLWGAPWDAGWWPPDTLTADLGVRERTIDYAAATISVRAASDELLAQDARIVMSRPVEALPTRILAVLAAASITVTAHDLAAAAPFVSMAAAEVELTQSVWDFLVAQVTPLGLRLWCDETRTWRCTVADVAPTASVALPRVTSCTDSIDRDGDWHDAIVWTGRGINDDGISIVDTRHYPDPIPAGARVQYVEVDYGQAGAALPMPSTDELAQRLALSSARERVLTITAPADPTIRPGVGLVTGAPSLPAMDTVAARVELDVPADTITITTRSTTEA